MARARPKKRNGVEFRSTFETHVAEALDNLGVTWEYEKFSLRYLKPIRAGVCPDHPDAKVYQERWYTPDFWLPEHNFFIEGKGKFGQAERMKMRLVKDAHPDEDIRMVFMRDNYIGRKSVTRTTYIGYAEKYGLPSLTLENIEEWFNG